mmetsp:Transcript_25245/g.63529  ORF Transcript_25245/g.63529 Transcript_25245/m.63529 type:complete len:327 (-) Transcript_25245:148-1128(-)
MSNAAMRSGGWGAKKYGKSSRRNGITAKKLRSSWRKEQLLRTQRRSKRRVVSRGHRPARCWARGATDTRSSRQSCVLLLRGKVRLRSWKTLNSEPPGGRGGHSVRPRRSRPGFIAATSSTGEQRSLRLQHLPPPSRIRVVALRCASRPGFVEFKSLQLQLPPPSNPRLRTLFDLGNQDGSKIQDAVDHAAGPSRPLSASSSLEVINGTPDHDRLEELPPQLSRGPHGINIFVSRRHGIPVPHLRPHIILNQFIETESSETEEDLLAVICPVVEIEVAGTNKVVLGTGTRRRVRVSVVVVLYFNFCTEASTTRWRFSKIFASLRFRI